MHQIWPIFRMALRAAAWKPTPDIHRESLSGFVLWLVLALAATVGFDYIMAEAGAQFSPQGLTSEAGVLALTSLIAAFFVRRNNRATFLCAILAIAVIVNAVFATLAVIGPDLWPPIVGWWRRLWLPFAAAYLVWAVGSQVALLSSFELRSRGRQIIRSVGLAAATLAAFALFPHYPVFVGTTFNPATANAWEYGRSILLASDPDPSASDHIDRARVELGQPALMDQAVASLAPHVKGATDIYALGIAAWSEQDVFTKELDGALESVRRTLPISGHTLRLINHRDSIAEVPVATRQNFAAAVRAIGKVMDKEEDVLLLFMTSHGYTSGVTLYFPGLASAWLAPEDVAAVLDREGIQNRIVIVSACHSGVFVPPLANENSIILTASDADSVSFGCSNEREWTYFGDAFFNRSLKPGTDLHEAFAGARKIIAQWEARDGLPPSNPTAHFGRALMDKLAGVYMPRSAANPERADTSQATTGLRPALP